MSRTTAAILVAAFAFSSIGAAHAAEPLHVYGPGGPMPALKETAAAFGASHGITVEVTAGPTPTWIGKAKADADVVFSGSETMMTDFIAAFGGSLDPKTVTPLYLRPAAILVRPGNPGHITGIRDLLKPGHRVLVVNGAGQNGLWEDVAGRLGGHRQRARLPVQHRDLRRQQRARPAGVDRGRFARRLADLVHLAGVEPHPGRPGGHRAGVSRLPRRRRGADAEGRAIR